ncbi:hypothetical protein F4820DRAFT_419779 [Hypoxylon rubiginosum]|uniref:Uncharacterized protein n=1 Tax=Hypoxylon rubiginosum TaxID=110542 RepID=A0ACB9Z1S4_9PEZI|nr:hypothetical protein F4820DRAFT_419779 [Hypoxylon rubiginosum]
MKTSFVLAAIATVVSMTGATQSVDDLFKALKHDPHGYSGLTEDGKVVSYDKDKNIIDSKQADPLAVEEYKKKWGQDADPLADSRTSARRSDEELMGLAKRLVCNEQPCDDDLDCQYLNCYGGCRIPPFIGKLRCYP